MTHRNKLNEYTVLEAMHIFYAWENLQKLELSIT